MNCKIIFPFITRTLQQMANARADFTRFFTALTRYVEHVIPAKAGIPVAAQNTDARLRGHDEVGLETYFTSQPVFADWKAEWDRLRAPDALALMRKHNPVYIARNHRVEEALAAASEGDLAPLHRLLSAVQQPFRTRNDLADFENAPAPQEEVLQTFCGT